MLISNVTKDELAAVKARIASSGNSDDASARQSRAPIHPDMIDCEHKTVAGRLTNCPTCRRWKIQCKKENIPVTADHCYYFCKLSLTKPQ